MAIQLKDEIGKEQSESQETRHGQERALAAEIQKIGQIGGWEYDLHSKKIFCTEQVYKIHQLPINSNPDINSYLSFYPVHEYERLKNFIDKFLKGQALKETFEFIDRIGIKKWVEITTNPIKDSDGNVVKILGTIQDITEHKIRQKNLETAYVKLDYLVNFSPSGIFETDHEGNCTFVNRTWTELTGMNFEEAKGYGWTSTIHPQDWEKVISAWNLFIKKDKSFDITFRYLHRDGSIKFVHCQSIEVKNAEGKIIGNLGSVQDITNQLELQKKLEKRDAALEALFSQSQDAIMTVNPPKWTFTTCNEATLKLFEIDSREEFTKLGPWNVSPEVQPDGEKSETKAQRMIQKAMLEGKHFFEWQHQTLSGKKIFCAVLLSKVAVSNEVYLQSTVRDISQEKQALLNLEEIKIRLASILENSPTAIYERQNNTELTTNYISPYIENITGYPYDIFVQQDSNCFMNIIHPEDLERVKNSICLSIKENKSFDIQYRLLHLNGETRWVWERGSFLIPTNTIIGVIIDINEQKIIQENLKNKTQELEQVLKAISISAIVSETDLSGKIIEANKQFCNISGYSKEELIGKTHNIVNSGLHSKEFFKTLWNTISSGQVWSGIIQNRNKQGGIYIVRTVIFPVSDIDGNIKKYISIRFDITDQYRTERQLEEAQKVARIGSWLFNPLTGKTEWSKQMYELFCTDVSKEPPSYEERFLNIHPDDKDRWKQTIDNSITNGTPYKIRYRIVFLDKIAWLEGIGKPIKDAEGRVVSIYGTCQDITDTVKTEELLNQEKAKTLQNAKLASLGEMSAGIAHEINNPLAIVSGNILLMKKYINEPEKLNEKIDNITKATDRITKIVKGLKKYSRSSEGQIHKIESIASIVSESLIITEAKAKRNNVPIETNIPNDMKILCDSVEIEQVLVNLINNGVDAIKNNEEKWIKINVFEENGVIFQVIDSGNGIPSHIEQKLFQPFFTSKPVGEGTGLGLSIVKGILDQHKATIKLNHAIKNTCFEIFFPYATEIPNGN